MREYSLIWVRREGKCDGCKRSEGGDEGGGVGNEKGEEEKGISKEED